MKTHDYILALAMNHGVAKLTVGNVEIPVKITSIDSDNSPGASPMTTVGCLVVNDDQIRNSVKSQLNSAYGEGVYKSPYAIKRVIFNDPATIVYWADGSKTVVKCQEGDIYSKETGLALCIAKKALGNKGNFNEVFKKYIPEEEVESLYPSIPCIPAFNSIGDVGSSLLKLASDIVAKYNGDPLMKEEN